MNKHRTSPVTFLLILLLSGAAAGQGAHYTYPFSLVCPERLVIAGESVSIEAKFEGGHTGERYQPAYNWSVSAGQILSGQGTPAITMQVPAEEGAVINVSLQRSFLEAHFPGVQREASCAIAIQTVPVARMTDEFKTRGSNCEDGFARLDGLLVELGNDPNAAAVIALYGDTRDRKAASRRELQLRNHLIFRKFGRDRITYVRGVDRVDGTTQFWMVPPGAAQPSIERGAETFEAPPARPYLYAESYTDGVPGCFGHLFDIEEYGRTLRESPGSRGRLIIRVPSRSEFNRTLKELTADLAKEGIPRSRFTALYKYVRPNRLLEVVELWVVPAAN
jgi:hypothetical protein